MAESGAATPPPAPVTPAPLPPLVVLPPGSPKLKKSPSRDSCETAPINTVTSPGAPSARKRRHRIGSSKDIPNSPFLPHDAPQIIRTAFKGMLGEVKKMIQEDPACVTVTTSKTLLTPLHCACMTGQPMIVTALVAAGASVSARDATANTPLHYCVYYSHAHTARQLAPYLERPKHLDAKNDLGLTPLYVAVARGDVKLTSLLLELGANPNIASDAGRTPLHEAALIGDAQMTELLIKRNANPSACDPNKMTPLHYASIVPEEHVEVISSLVRAKSELHAEDSGGMIPLVYCLLNRFENCLNLFVQGEYGVDVCTIYATKQRMREGKAARLPPVPAPAPVPLPPRLQQLSMRRASGVFSASAATLPAALSPQSFAQPGTANRYGFVVDSSLTRAENASERQMRKENSRAIKWSKMLARWDVFGDRKKKKARSRAAKGIPDCVRGRAWLCLLGTEAYRKSVDPANARYTQLLQVVPDAKDAVQIDLDIRRAHQEHELYRGHYEEGQLRLFNVLRAYSKHDPQLGYTQGMADLTGLLLMYMTEEDAFWSLVTLMHGARFDMHGFFETGFPALFKFCVVQEALVKERLPVLYAHLRRLGIDVEYPHAYTMEWYMLLFTRVLPFECCLRVLDLIFCEGFHAAASIGLALLKLMEPALVHIHDDCVLIQALKNPVETIKDISADLLVKTASEMSISHRLFDSLCAQYDAAKAKRDAKAASPAK